MVLKEVTDRAASLLRNLEMEHEDEVIARLHLKNFLFQYY